MGVKLGSPSRRTWLSALARYYRIDLLHNWSSFTLLLGSKFAFVTRLLFGVVSNRYDSLAKASDVLDDGYYWLRRLESHLLAGRSLTHRRQVENKLSDLEIRHSILQNTPQAGNIHVYRGLIAFVEDRDKQAALFELNRAEAAWRRAGRDMSSGHRRVLLFRRYFGATGVTFLKTLKSIAKGGSTNGESA